MPNVFTTRGVIDVTTPEADVIEFLGIAIFYSESYGLAGYWIFLIFAFACYIEYSGGTYRPWSFVIPILLYFIQPHDVGGDIHLSLATIAAWTWIIRNLMHKPAQSVASFEIGRRIGKKMFDD